LTNENISYKFNIIRFFPSEIRKGGEFMSTKTFKLLMILVLISFFTTGCYYWAAKKEMKSAEQLLSELKREGGPALVPYEYCSAEKFLEVSKGEFGDNDFKQAKEFAVRSKSAAQTGLTEVKKKK